MCGNICSCEKINSDTEGGEAGLVHVPGQTLRIPASLLQVKLTRVILLQVDNITQGNPAGEVNLATCNTAVSITASGNTAQGNSATDNTIFG